MTEPEFTRQFWMNTTQESEWKPGASWRIAKPNGESADSGEVVEIDPPRKLVLTWQNHLFPEMNAEGFSRLTYQLEEQGDMVKLTVTHEMDRSDSKFIKAVSNGWPVILASLKSFLETGNALEATRHWPKNL
jgi:uncharacterized protein YndB with AHSA1/START domain